MQERVRRLRVAGVLLHWGLRVARDVQANALLAAIQGGMPACSAAYSYAYDDATSTFTCTAGAADYLITFCPATADSADQA